MNLFTNKFSVVRTICLRLGIVLLMLTLTRIIFFIFNTESFPQAELWDFILGIFFDVITVSLVFAPFILIDLLPILKFEKWKKIILKVYFHIANSSMIALNLMDTEYFEFTNKRSTIDLFTILRAGEDFNQLFTTFLVQFWYIILMLILLIFASEWLYRKSQYKNENSFHWRRTIMNYAFFIPIIIVLGRGGFQLKPVSPIEAARFGNPQNTALVLNTTFTMIKSIGKEQLEMKSYFDEKTALTYFNPIQKSTPQNILDPKTNVVLIILESFGNEFTNKNDPKLSYTPFFDSLLKQSLNFQNAYANGRKSIEAVPAILSSIPSLMETPYISSPYANNSIFSIATILKEHGYNTTFFHGATNGSMRFNAFSSQIGFDAYFGRTEYNNDEHFDGTWGISDEYFNPWMAKKLTTFKQPFFTTLFTISSHHPYFIPQHMKKHIKYGKEPICASLNYADFALRKFFEEAKKQPWYNNTLFILVADHTPASNNPEFSGKNNIYRIPIAFYHPKKEIKKQEQNLFQQIDILPTLLDYLNISTEFYSFGSSYFSNKRRFAINYMEGVYYYFFDHYMMTYVDGETPEIFDIDTDKNINKPILIDKTTRIALTNHLKALIQRYNNDILKNKTFVK
jgi:phosphoglycerol transferase MdoB-like AlkP superfamily enzyme